MSNYKHTFPTSSGIGTVTYGAGATVGGISGAGTVLSTGANGVYTAWTHPNTNFSSSNNKSIMTIPHGEERVILEEAATFEVKGTVKINGIDLEERLKTIERVLAIPERDVTMEAKYPKLKKLYEEYINTLEKYRTFERIKGDSNDN